MIELGDEVECQVTGLKGIAVSRTVYLHGMDQIGIQPRLDADMKMKDAYNVDETVVKVLKKFKFKIPEDLPVEKSAVALADEVEDPVTKFRGTVTAITYWLNGCSRCSVTPKLDKDGKPQDTYYFDRPRLKILRAANRKKETTQKTGGPNQPVPPRR